MNHWIAYAFATIVALASADVFIKLAAGKLSNSVAMLIYGTCVFSISILWVLWDKFIARNELRAEPHGVVFAIGVGICFCLVTLGLYLTFGAGAPISVASPMIRLGGVIVASLVGLSLFGELLTMRYVVGVCLALIGVCLIVTR